MKTIELDEATNTLAEYAREVATEPVLLTKGGNPVAALLSIDDVDLESLLVSKSSVFWEIIQQSRAQMATEGGISPNEMRRRLGLPERKKQAFSGKSKRRR